MVVLFSALIWKNTPLSYSRSYNSTAEIKVSLYRSIAYSIANTNYSQIILKIKFKLCDLSIWAFLQFLSTYNM